MHLLNSKVIKSLGLIFGSAVLLTACGPAAVQLEAAPDAANPQCAYAMVAMPKTLAGLDQRATTAQATTAWGEPADVIIKCGVELSDTPVSDPCASVNGVDWILKPQESSSSQAPGSSATAVAPSSTQESSTGTWTATTYGREPALRVTFTADKVSSSTILAELSSAVKQLPVTKQCTNLDDSLENLKTQS